MMKMNLLFLDCTQLSCFIQQASRPSQGISPGHPLYKRPQYFPYLKKGGTAFSFRQKHKKIEIFKAKNTKKSETPYEVYTL